MLARGLKETTTLEILEGDSVLTVAYSDATGMSRDRSGRSSPLHATAPGKVLLANQPEREVIRLSKVGFTPYTSHTIVRVDLLLEELARVRKRGFATAFGEFEPSVNAIAVPGLRSADFGGGGARGPSLGQSHPAQPRAGTGGART